MLIYSCNSLDETDVGVSAPCDGMVGQSVSDCLQDSLIAGWAVGGTVSSFIQLDLASMCTGLSFPCLRLERVIVNTCQ